MIHAGKFEDTLFVLDVESGSLHELDELAWDICRLMEAGAQDAGEIIAALGGKYAAADIQDALDELGALHEAGLFDSPPLAGATTPVFNDPAIKSLCLHIAHDCNLRCSYCFAAEGTYMGERSLMSAQTGKKALDFLIAQSKNRKHLEVDFFGGEPLINFDVVREITAYGRTLEKQTGKIIRFTLTTNAYHVTDEMVDFINSEMKNLVISIDGRREIHDAERKNAAGQGSYDKVCANARRLIAGRGEKEYYIRGTFTSRNLDFAADAEAIADMGFDQLSIEPVVTDGPLSLHMADLPAIQAEYERLGAIMEARRKEGRGFNFFHFMVDFSSGPCLNKRLRGCGAGIEYAAITPSGDIYPCHQFVGEERFRMGNVCTGVFDPSVAAPFLDCHIYNKPVCRDCFAKYFCSGGCAANAWKMNGDILQPHAVSCAIQRARLDTAIGLYIRRNA